MNGFISRLVIVTLALVLGSVSTSHAYHPFSHKSCTSLRFAQNPHVVLHTTEMVGFSFIEKLLMIQVMEHIHAQIDDVPANIQIASFETSTEPFTFKDWYEDDEPTIHIGFTDDPPVPNPAAAGRRPNLADCTIKEAHIYLKDGNVFRWSLTEPEGVQNQGPAPAITASVNADNLPEPYYMAGITPPCSYTPASGGKYLYITYLHELLHTLGLAHSNDGYSMLNSGHRPWANRDHGEKVMPLPDDVKGLQFLYGATGSKCDVAVLNSWYEPEAFDFMQWYSGTIRQADQYPLCAPSTGTGWDDADASICGVGGSTDVCEDDTIYTRVALSNYGTEGVSVTLRAYFSTDDVLDANDTPAPEVRSGSVAGPSSSRFGRVYSVPSGLKSNTEYYVIIKASASCDDSDTNVISAIPLRGTVTVHGSGSATCNK